MDWLFVVGLGIIWVALLAPSPRRAAHRDGVQEFARGMEILAQTERTPSRVILVPRKDEKFLGPRGRAHIRARDRRRRTFSFLVGAFGFTAIVGLAPQVRMMWIATLLIGAALLAYVVFLLRSKADYHADLRRAPKRAVPVATEPQTLENEIRVFRAAKDRAQSGSVDVPLAASH